MMIEDGFKLLNSFFLKLFVIELIIKLLICFCDNF